MTGPVLRHLRLFALIFFVGTFGATVNAQPLLDGTEALQQTIETKETPTQQGSRPDVNPAADRISGKTPLVDPFPPNTKIKTTVPSTPMAVSVAEVKQKLAEWRVDLNHATVVLQRSGLTRNDLNTLQSDIESLRLEAQDLRRIVVPSVEALRARLKQLAPTKKDEVESEDIKETRTNLETELAAIQGVVKQIKVVGLRTDEIIHAVDERRRTIFAERLFEYHSSIFALIAWTNAYNDLPEVMESLRLLVSDWWGLITKKIGSVAGLFLISLAVAIFVLLTFSHRLLLRWAIRNPDATTPSMLRKAWAALTILVVNLVLPLVGVIVFFGVLELLGVSPNRIDQLARTVFFTVLALAAAHGLSRALLAPERSGWRMVPLTDWAAERLMVLIFLIAVVLGLNIFLDGMSRNLLSPITISVMIHGTLSIAFHILILMSLKIISTGRTEPDAPARDETEQRTTRSLFWRWIIPLAWLASLLGLVATLIGYISFGWFIATQIVWTAAILGLLHLLLIFVDEVFTTGLRKSIEVLGTRASGLATVSPAGEQFGVIVSGILRLILIAFAATLILSPWGVRSSKLLNSIEAVFFGIQIGDVTFSLSAILVALAIFTAGMLGTRSIQRWIELNLLPRTNLDVGLKTSIKTAIGYFGIIVAGMIAFSYVGLDLQNIAIVAGALSVGIGFGLQSVVNNFVSGLILLAERPIKVGDWIVVGSEQGYVRKINVRATEIETFDRAAVIVPNSDLISGVVKNWMHNDTSGRIIVGVGVAYDSNPDQVREILLECAREQQMVLAYPAPSVYFMEFGASSLDFQLRCYLGSIDYAMSVSSDIRFALFRRLGEAGIEIPFPQRDINLRDMDRLDAIWSGNSVSEKNTGDKTENPATDK